MIRSAALADYAPPAAAADHGALRLEIRAVVLLLALMVAGVIAASLGGALALLRLGFTRAQVPEVHDQLSILLKLMLKCDAGGEQTVAAWLSAIILLLCALVLLQIAASERQRASAYAWHWLGLAVIFCGLSMDEAVGLHEMTILPMRQAFGASGIFLYAWVIPALLLVALVGLASLGFLRHLEPTFRVRFVAAAALFAGGAIGFEMLEGALADWYPRHRLIYELAVNLEDAVEFLGELLFLHSLLVYLRHGGPRLVLRLT